MAYDASKVEFTPDEHRMATILDSVVEQFKDGFQFSDIGVIIGALPLVEFIGADGDRAVTVRRLIALAVMLERDNEYIDGIVDAVGGTPE